MKDSEVLPAENDPFIPASMEYSDNISDEESEIEISENTKQDQAAENSSNDDNKITPARVDCSDSDPTVTYIFKRDASRFV